MILKRLAFKIGLAMVALLSSAEVVENIDLNGLEILNYEKVKPYLEIQVGQDINRDDIRSQIKTLYASGYFQQVSVSIEDGQLNIVLDEQPVIHDIEISSDGIPSDAVENGLKDAKIEKGELLNELHFAKFIAGLKASMQSAGFKNNEVSITITPYSKHSVDIKIDILVKTRVKLRAVEFAGQPIYSAFKLKRYISSRTTGPLSFLMDDDLYSDAQIEYDRQRLVAFYQSQGYLDANVRLEVSDIVPQQRVWRNEYKTVKFVVEPNARFRVKEISVEDPFGVLSQLQIKGLQEQLEGQYFIQNDILSAQENLVAKIQHQNRRFIISADLNKTVDHEVSITMRVQEVKSKIRFIHFLGNYNTKDQTLRKTVTLQEQDLFLESDLQSSQEALMGRPYIAGASYKVQQVDEEYFDIFFTVNESKKSFDFGGSGQYSNGLNMNIYVVDQNVFGSGDALTANITASSKSQQAKVSYSQPNYSGNGAGRSISANISRLSRDGEDTTNYSFDEYGLSSSWSMPISKTISTGIQASYSRMNFFNVDKASSLVQQYFENRSHELDIASVGTTLSYSDLDNAYEPTKGKSLRGSVKTTLPVSDAAKFYNFETEGRYYYPLTEMFDQAIVFRTRLLYSHAMPYDGDDLPFFARKYAGGMGTVRGYENGMLGQKYQDDVFNEIDGNKVLIASKVKAKGGGILAVGNAEVQLPSPMPDFVTPCLFVDIGNVFENYDSIDLSMLRGSAGITFSAKLPVMQAKVSLSFGVPFNQGDEEYDMMSFGFGTMF